MDALALLCTLYAEGPVTLARLRQADCSTIEAVLAADSRALASILVSTEATAQRFQREARSLGDRVGTGDTGSETGPHDVSPSTGVQSRPNLLDRVLAAWREHDEHDADASAEGLPQIADTASEREEILQPAIPSREPKMPRTIAAAALSASVLPSNVLDGLDSEAATALARAGVRTLRTLAVCDALVVARASGISWSRVNRLRSLAARAPGIAEILAQENRAVQAAAAQREADGKVSPSERPLLEHAGITQLEGAEQSALAATQTSRSRPKSAPQSMPTATTAPRHAPRAPEGAGGPFA